MALAAVSVAAGTLGAFSPANQTARDVGVDEARRLSNARRRAARERRAARARGDGATAGAGGVVAADRGSAGLREDAPR